MVNQNASKVYDDVKNPWKRCFKHWVELGRRDGQWWK